MNPELAMPACVSGDFYTEGNDKEGLGGYLENVIEQGMLSDAELDTEASETFLDGDTASIENIPLSGGMGSVTMDLQMQKEPDGAWRIIGMDAY